MSPLYRLLRKDIPFIWLKFSQESYDAIKQGVTSGQGLVHLNRKLPLVLVSDASKSAVEGILSHKFSDGERPMTFVSRELSTSEKNNSRLEKDALAIVFCVTKL